MYFRSGIGSSQGVCIAQLLVLSQHRAFVRQPHAQVQRPALADLTACVVFDLGAAGNRSAY